MSNSPLQKQDDWRSIDKQLNQLEDPEYHGALRDRGVRAVLPSNKKQRVSDTSVGEQTAVRARWATGDWVERVDKGDLPQADKFMEDPLRPPTCGGPRYRPPTPAPVARPTKSLPPQAVWVAGAGVAVAAVALLWALLS